MRVVIKPVEVGMAAGMVWEVYMKVVCVEGWVVM